MKQALSPMFDFTERCIVYDKGRYPLQLEIPRGSSVSDDDIDRILHVSSWEEDDMGGMVDAYEGARGVKIRKEKPGFFEGIEIADLYIAGVGYRKMRRSESNVDSVFTYGNKMSPRYKELL